MTRLPLVALLAALALGTVACGDDADPESGPTTAPTSEPTTEPSTSEPPTTEPPPEPSEPPTPEPTTTPPTPEPTATAPTVEPTEVPGPGPTSYDDALARFDAQGQEPQPFKRFETSTGVYCLLDSDFLLGCELPAAAGVPDPEYCGDGPTEQVGRIAFGEGAPTPECNSDTIREPGARVLELDTVGASRRTGIQCLAEDIGVTCLDTAARQGFFLGPEQYAVFSG